MVISDIECVEEVAQSDELDISGGIGGAGLSSLLNLISNSNPASSASILNLGNTGNSINTAISFNFSMPITMVFNRFGNSGFGSNSTADSPVAYSGYSPFRRRNY